MEIPLFGAVPLSIGKSGRRDSVPLNPKGP
jgi:hypothetical protein